MEQNSSLWKCCQLLHSYVISCYAMLCFVLLERYNEWILYAHWWWPKNGTWFRCYMRWKCSVIYWCKYKEIHQLSCHCHCQWHFAEKQRRAGVIFIRAKIGHAVIRACRHFVFLNCIFDHVLSQSLNVRQTQTFSHTHADTYRHT